MQLTQAIQKLVDELLTRNDYTQGRTAREVYLSDKLVVIRLAEVKVIEGQCTEVEGGDRTVDILDLIDNWQSG